MDLVKDLAKARETGTEEEIKKLIKDGEAFRDIREWVDLDAYQENHVMRDSETEHLKGGSGDIDDHKNYFVNTFRGLFVRVIADEGQNVKDSATRAHKSIHTLFATETWIVSAIPADNKVTDLLGALNLFWDPNWMKVSNPDNTDDEDAVFESDKGISYYDDSFAKEFMADHPNYKERYQSLELWMLSPKNFAYTANKGYLKDSVARRVILAITKLLVLRLTIATKSTVNGKPTSLSEHILPCAISTVELEAPPLENLMADAIGN